MDGHLSGFEDRHTWSGQAVLVWEFFGKIQASLGIDESAYIMSFEFEKKKYGVLGAPILPRVLTVDKIVLHFLILESSVQ